MEPCKWNLGDEVWNVDHGWGKVVQISGRRVLVRFETFVSKEFDCDDPMLSEIGFSPPLDEDDLYNLCFAEPSSDEPDWLF